MNSDSTDPPASSSRWNWGILVVGLAVWLGVQGYLILMPVLSRSEPPEPDDTLPYIARSARMEQCFWCDCPALKDLTIQFSGPSPNEEVATYRNWAGTIFGANQLGLSVVLICLKRIGLDLMTGYRVTCFLAVLLFGGAFAYLLTVLWGKQVAGLALLLLAFKVFPDTGLNFVVPSNLSMGLATLIWARVIAKGGKALWTLGIGSVVLVAFHPMGAAYALMAAMFALALSGITFSRRTWVTAAVVALVLLLALLVPSTIYNLSQYFQGVSPGELLKHGALSFVTVAVEIVRLDAGFHGPLPLFLGCIALGWISASSEQRGRLAIFVKIFSVFLALSLFYPPRQPGDTFLRLWIPFVVVMFGAVAMAWWSALTLAWESLKKFRTATGETLWVKTRESWPILLAAVITGYVVQLSMAGAEQVAAISEHYRNRQPLMVCSSQTEKLLAKAAADDKVLYESMMLMQCYFARGALNLGAVYYHPVLEGTATDAEWLTRPDLRFVVAYNPLVIHPSFEGLHERRWGVSSPDFRFSPLMGARRYGPLLHEDGISVRRFKHIDVEWDQSRPPHTMTVMVDNPGGACVMRAYSIDGTGLTLESSAVSLNIPERSGQPISWVFEGTLDMEDRTWSRTSSAVALKVDLESLHPVNGRLRLKFPIWNSRARIVGLKFDDSQLNWPWEHKARLVITDKSWDVGSMEYSFDPAKILPKRLQHSSVKVLSDCGSSVLMKIVDHLPESTQ